MSSYWRFARYMLRYPAPLIVALVMAVVSAAGLGIGLAAMVPITQLMLEGEEARSLVDLAEEFNAEGHPVAVPAAIVERLPTDPLEGVVLIIAGLCVLSVFGAMASFLHQYLSAAVAIVTVTHIRQVLFRHSVFLPLIRVVRRGPSEFVARVVRDAGELQRGLVALVSKSVAQATKGAACFAVALVVSWEATAIALAGGLVFVVVLRKLGKRVRRGTRGSLAAQEQLLRIATEAIQGLRTVKANTAERHATRRFNRINRQVLAEELRARKARSMSGPLVENLATFMVAGLAILFAGRIIRGGMDFPQFMIALTSLAAAGASFKPLAGIVNEIQAASAPAQRLEEILDEVREDRDGRARPPRTLPRHRRSVRFEHVTFRYPGSDRPALDDVTLTIEHGRRVALVGPNGSGKTTLVSLLPRLLRPSDGRVLIDDVDIESVRLRDLRRQIGVVAQETVMFRGTIADNIALGLPGVDQSAIEEAARRARADEFIRRIPGGYEANVAEQGASLSGGQRQRLAIARAILRDPSLLILDEATSQIDSESESRISEALREFCSQRTAIVIAHRLASVLDADSIVVMDEGRIVDEGSHEVLVERCEVYRGLVQTQLVG